MSRVAGRMSRASQGMSRATAKLILWPRQPCARQAIHRPASGVMCFQKAVTDQLLQQSTRFDRVQAGNLDHARMADGFFRRHRRHRQAALAAQRVESTAKSLP